VISQHVHTIVMMPHSSRYRCPQKADETTTQLFDLLQQYWRLMYSYRLYSIRTAIRDNTHIEWAKK